MGDHASAGRGLSDAPAPSDASAPDPEAIERGRLLFAQDCVFTAGAASLDALPADDLAEIAFAGRSNVGKSSLLNALTGRNALARVSHTPGRTRQLNFFALGRRLMLVDMPGYGYAEAPKAEIARWNALIRDYLRGRASLRRTCLLIDARHGIKAADRPLMAMLDETAVSFQVVLTKADKVKAAALASCLERIGAELKTHTAAHPEILVTSAHEGSGIPELRAALAALAAPAPLARVPAARHSPTRPSRHE
jgi:GTP-binding protein